MDSAHVDGQDQRFRWTRLYQAIADKLLDYRNDRGPLIECIHGIAERVGSLSVLQDRFADSSTGPLDDICPFTTMATFNRGVTAANKLAVVKELAEFLGVDIPVPDADPSIAPDAFPGIPVVINQKTWFFGFSKDREDDDIDALWNVFAAALRFAHADTRETRADLTEAYDRALNVKGVAWNLSMALYWVRPWDFVPLDGPSRNYISKELGMHVPTTGGTKPGDGESYLRFLDELKTRFDDESCPVLSFPELSLAAWNFGREPAPPAVEPVGDGRTDEAARVAEEFETGPIDEGQEGKTADDEHALNNLLEKFDLGREQLRVAVLDAIEDLGANGWDAKHNSKVYDLVHDDKKLPPKEVLRRAFEICTGEEWTGAPTSGGDQTNGPLSALGYRIEGKSTPGEVQDLKTYSVENVLSEGCFLERREIEHLLERLQTRKNLILQGPPGTGKTWLARRLAFALIGERDDSKVRVVQFHPNLSYEDFVRGWRPVGDGKLALTDGVFMETLRAASADSSAKFVVVIEEINRGNPAQIFGELLTLLEADKRSPRDAVELCYPDADGTRRPVHVPENLHVIGTMNIADRSLALVDLALRRRFAFVTLKPNLGKAWSNWVIRERGIDPELVEEIRRRINTLNDRIAADARLGSQFQVGHSYVTPTDRLASGATKDWFRQEVETGIGPLLEEYWFDSPADAKETVQQLLDGW